ncbi:S-adenosyl-L-methionine-dependent methyltransferase superfamily protein [Rhynchospora pubera]|uniref:S-adenosyl-L-methionine-dependent methyltransferase superfamily protein n=1 Tax=Rhynchospora pubera TaxID=906938 RepID=A0AAV8F1Z9_9POAL|nr:S-adenosyl-L-methionine-dependent methyltransferase superfamily protein [Rhynchospora pubera]
MQKGIASNTIFLVKEAVKSLASTVPSSEKLLVFADLGCSTGANTLVMFSEVMDTVSTTCNELGRPVPQIQLLLNDLPGNDFNTLLGSVLSFRKERIDECTSDRSMPFYMSVVPGSFYERLFPKKSVHFIYSSCSVHWLSQVPMGLYNVRQGWINKGSIYISEKSPPLVSSLYLKQFQRDFSLFLKHRSEELCSGTCMALIFPGCSTADQSAKETAAYIACLEEALDKMVSEGVVNAFDVDSFNLPLYHPTMDEVKFVIKNEGSFELMQDFIHEAPFSEVFGDTHGDTNEKWEKLGLAFRSILESLFVSVENNKNS